MNAHSQFRAGRNGLALADLPDWPTCLDQVEAVAYTGFSASEIARAERDGKLCFKAMGPHGRKVVPRKQLDAFVDSVFVDRKVSNFEDLDCG